MKFRQAVLADLGEMQELFVSTIRSTCKDDYKGEQIEAWTSSVKNKERWKGKLAQQNFLVAELGETMVGFGSLENGNYLDFMYVHKDYQRQGIANAIYEKLKEKSVGLGFGKLTSDVSKTARPFFESKGFKVVKENKNMINGIEIINYQMSQ